MLLMVIKSSVVRKRPRMMRGCCEYSRRSPCLLGLPYYLITRKRIKGEEGMGQSQPEEPGGGQTTRRDSGEVPGKEPQSRLSRRNRERRSPEQVQNSPDRFLPSPLRVKEKRRRRERPRRKLRRGPSVGFLPYHA